MSCTYGPGKERPAKSGSSALKSLFLGGGGRDIRMPLRYLRTSDHRCSSRRSLKGAVIDGCESRTGGRGWSEVRAKPRPPFVSSVQPRPLIFNNLKSATIRDRTPREWLQWRQPRHKDGGPTDNDRTYQKTASRVWGRLRTHSRTERHSEE